MSGFKDLKIVFVGEMVPGMRSFQRFEILNSIIPSVVKISTRNNSHLTLLHRLKNKAFRAFNLVYDEFRADEQLYEIILKEPKVDIIWLEKAAQIRRETLLAFKKKFKNGKIVFLSEDEMFLSHNQNPNFLNTIDLYDLFVTTKK